MEAAEGGLAALLLGYFYLLESRLLWTFEVTLLLEELLYTGFFSVFGEFSLEILVREFLVSLCFLLWDSACVIFWSITYSSKFSWFSIETISKSF